MKKLLSLAAVLGFLCFPTGSFAEDVPACGDPTVKKLVLEISMESLRNQLLTMAIIQKLHMHPGMAGNPTYASWDKLRGKDPDIDKTLAAVDSQMSAVSASVTSIRTRGKEPETRASWCAALLEFTNGNSLPIEYTAQYTDDHEEVFVEVYGLE